MTDEDAFLRAILDAPTLSTPRLVYADWLDDQADPFSARKAAYIRLEARLAETPERSLNRVRFTRQLRQLAVGLDADWLAVVAHPALEACRVRFQFECPARWDRLTPTADVRVRYCGSCDRAVFFCDTLADAQRHAAVGECVAITPALVRRQDDLTPLRPPDLPPEQIDLLRLRTVRAGGLIFESPPSRPMKRPAREEEPNYPHEWPLRPEPRKRRSKRVRPEDTED